MVTKKTTPLSIGGFYAFFIVYIVLICGGFYVDNKHATINKLASDNWSIAPIALKLQDTTLFAKDQFANNTKAIKTYIPAFVNTLLFFRDIQGGDIFQGYNLFNLVTTALHILLWFFVFFKLTGNHWLSFLFTMVMRGILWPPGNEIWGVGNLEYFLPRTVFSALLPLFFWLLIHALQKRPFLLPVAFLCLGLVGNLHPISGLGTGVSAVFAIFCWGLLSKQPLKNTLTTAVISGFCFVVGLLPFVSIFLTEDLNQAAKVYDKTLFTSLISERIGGAFLGPWQLYKSYLGPQWLVLIVGSYLLSVAMQNRLKSQKNVLMFLWLLGGFIFLMPVFFYGMEELAHAVGFKFLNFSYELSRNSKYVIVPCFLLYAMGFEALLQTVPKRKLRISLISAIAFIVVSLLAKWPLQKAPGLKADFFRAQIPDVISRTNYLPYTFDNLDSVLAFVKQNTPDTATFAGPPQLRAGGLRSVPFDYKGASVLLQQNKPAYIEWALLNKQFEKIRTDSAFLSFYKKLPVDYLVTDEVSSTTDSLVFKNGKWRVYKLMSK